MVVAALSVLGDFRTDALNRRKGTAVARSSHSFVGEIYSVHSGAVYGAAAGLAAVRVASHFSDNTTS